MNISFSTLACPAATIPQVVRLASGAGYDGVGVPDVARSGAEAAARLAR